MQLKRGYGVFGKAYEVMLRKDLHAAGSIDHRLMESMILLEEESAALLYQNPPRIPSEICRNPLWQFAQQFKRETEKETIRAVLDFTQNIVQNFDQPFEQMHFGGTEQEILQRGTDWCADLARVGVVLLECLTIPARMVNLADRKKAYHGHVILEAFYEGKFGAIDPVYGYLFYENGPLSVWELQHHPDRLKQIIGCGDHSDYYQGLYDAAAISEYDPTCLDNQYLISCPNKYYLALIARGENDGQWILGEDKQGS